MENGESKPFGKGLYLGAGAQIIAENIEIGDRVMIGGGTIVYKERYLTEGVLAINRGGHVEQIKRDKAAYDRRMRSIFNVTI